MDFTEHITITITRIYSPTFSRVQIGDDIKPNLDANVTDQGGVLTREVERLRSMLDARAHKSNPATMISH